MATDKFSDWLTRSYRPTESDLSEERYFDGYIDAHSGEDVSELFHENTKLGHTESQRMTVTMGDPKSRSLMSLLSIDTPDHPESPLVELPTDVALPGDIADVLSTRRSRRDFSPTGLDLEQLSQLLDYAAGITGTNTADDSEEFASKDFRAYPSPGALYPVEVYPIVLHSEDLEAGVYYYSPATHGLRKLRTGADFDREPAEIFPDPIFRGDAIPSVVFALTGAFWRVKAKYGPRGYRYLLQESGHVGQNIQLVSQAIDVGSVPLGSFYDDELNELLGVDGVSEAVVYAIAAGNVA